MENRSFKDLKAYQLAFELAMEIFQISKSFPKEETYSLTDQIRRSSVRLQYALQKLTGKEAMKLIL